MSELKSLREILEELAAGDDRLRENFPRWLAERDRRKLPPKKPPASEIEDEVREANQASFKRD